MTISDPRLQRSEQPMKNEITLENIIKGIVGIVTGLILYFLGDILLKVKGVNVDGFWIFQILLPLCFGFTFAFISWNLNIRKRDKR